VARRAQGCPNAKLGGGRDAVMGQLVGLRVGLVIGAFAALVQWATRMFFRVPFSCIAFLLFRRRLTRSLASALPNNCTNPD
jgi:hypothetical protein